MLSTIPLQVSLELTPESSYKLFLQYPTGSEEEVTTNPEFSKHSFFEVYRLYQCTTATINNNFKSWNDKERVRTLWSIRSYNYKFFSLANLSQLMPALFHSNHKSLQLKM